MAIGHFYVISVTLIGFLLAIIASEKVRNNMRKNVSFFVILHHALRYQRNNVANTAEFAHWEEEKRARDRDFQAFTVAWLNMHRQPGHNPPAEVHAVAENTWTPLGEEAHCLKKMLTKSPVMNVPLAFCVKANRDLPYPLWSKCVETNTRYFNPQGTIVYFAPAGQHGETEKAALNGTGMITTRHMGNRWQWTVE